MTSTDLKVNTAIGIRVVFARTTALNFRLSPERDRVRLSTLHDAIGLLDEFCSIVNFGSMLESGAFNEQELAAFEEIYSFRNGMPDHSEALLLIDSDLRGLVAPVVRRVWLNSPFTIELIGSVSTGAFFLLKNPGMIGKWIPTVREHWFNAQAEAEKAKRAYQALTDAGIEVEELED